MRNKNLEFLARLEKEELEELDYFNKKYGSPFNLDQSESVVMSNKGIIRLIATCGFVLHKDVMKFRENLCKVSVLIKSLFDRHNQGEPIDDSFVTMNAYHYIFDAYAAGDFKLAEEFAEVIGGRKVIEKEHDHPFNHAYGYALKALILKDDNSFQHWLPLAKMAVEKKDVKYFRAYVTGLEAIDKQDSLAFLEAMKQLLEDHKRMCKKGGELEFTDDKYLCIWGLGLINLARHRGLDVTIDDELLPQELII